jgi:hypothetical protein
VIENRGMDSALKVFPIFFYIIFTFGIDVDFGVPHSSFGPPNACIVYFPIFKVRDPDNMKVVNFTKL